MNLAQKPLFCKELRPSDADEVWVFGLTREVRFFSYHEALLETKQLCYNGNFSVIVEFRWHFGLPK